MISNRAIYSSTNPLLNQFCKQVIAVKTWLVCVVTCLLVSNKSEAQIFGIVTDTTNAPLPNVLIFDKSGTSLGQTRLDGYFNLTLRNGNYNFVFSHSDFHNQEIPILITGKKDTLRVRMVPKTERIEVLTISKDWKDPGPQYMKQTIAMRDSWSKRLPPTSSTLYIKAWEESVNTQFKKPNPKQGLDTQSLLNKIDSLMQVQNNPAPTEKLDTSHVIKLDSSNNGGKRIMGDSASTVVDSATENTNASIAHIKKEKDYYYLSDTQRIASLVEMILTRDQAPPNKLKEVRHGVRKIGSKAFLFYLTAADGDFNPYQNLLNVPSLCPLPIMSPLSNSALLAYKFHYAGSYQHPKYGRVLKIQLSGRQTANATLNGELEIVDTAFWVLKSTFKFPKHLMAEYDEMEVTQYFQKDENNWIICDSMRFHYGAKFGKTMLKAHTIVDVKSRKINPAFKKNHFGLEIAKTTDSAYDRDSNFWLQQRTQPLSISQTKLIQRTDSLKRVLTSEKYLDSIEKKTNKVTFKSLVLEGQGYSKRKKGIDMAFQPLWSVYQPWWPGGTRLSMFSQLNKTFENKKSIAFSENLSYGIKNHDIRGTVYFSTLYNPYKRASVYISAGRDFGMINGNAAYLDVFRRNNFYVHNHLSAYHNQELINGLFLNVKGEYSQRQDMSSYNFDKLGDSLFENNTPALFNSNTAFYGTLTLSYTPFQRYISEPKQKVILGSAWPTFGIRVKKAIPGIFNSSIDYTYLEYFLQHDFPIGLFGTSEIRANSGSFVNYRNMSLIDYRYHRRGDPSIFTPPLYAFQQLDTTFHTFKRFFEVHYQHRFNGSLVNKIPFIKKLSLYERAGANFLYAPERNNMVFYEGYFGLDKIIRIWKDRYKIGIYYTAGYSNLFDKPRFGFKINFEYYDRFNNKW